MHSTDTESQHHGVIYGSVIECGDPLYPLVDEHCRQMSTQWMLDRDVVVSHPDPQTTGDFCREYSTGDVVFR
jgi:hypothetical protein